MKFEEKVKYFKDGELSAQTMFRIYGLDQIENDVIEYQKTLKSIKISKQRYFYKGYISKANEIIADCYRDDREG